MEAQQLQPRTDYMRQYMRNQYQTNPIKMKQYRNSCRVKAKLNIPDEEFERYKHYLADIVKLREIITRVPTDILLEIIIPPIANENPQSQHI
jgi:hypothetical protein